MGKKMKMNHQVKYALCIGGTAILAIVSGLFFYNQINDDVAVVSWGAPLFIYFALAHFFHLGEVFNFVLFILVSVGYSAILFLPMYFAFKNSRWVFVIAQIGIVVVHILIGIALMN